MNTKTLRRAGYRLSEKHFALVKRAAKKNRISEAQVIRLLIENYSSLI